MGAIEDVFPNSMNLLCVWHIKNNIVENCKSRFEKHEEFERILLAWNDVVYYSTEEAFARSWEEIELSFMHRSDIMNYIMKVWLPHKERFVSARTDTYSHFGNRATSRGEGAHAKLKRYLLVSTGDLLGINDKMCLLIENDLQEFRTKLSSEKISIPIHCNIPFFQRRSHPHFVICFREIV